MVLNDHHETHVIDVRYNGQFPDLKVPGDLARKMVQTKKKHIVYLVVTFSLNLPVATTFVERTFSTMNIVKNQLQK